MKRTNLSHFRVALLICAAVSFAGCAPSIHDLAARGDTVAMVELLDADPDLVHDRNPMGQTPLYAAVNHKQIEAMALLVQRGAEVNPSDGTGMSPLHAAAFYGRSAEATWLLEHGADPAQRDSFGDTPLHTAALFGQGQIVELLHRRGIALDEANAAGKTAQDLARAEGRLAADELAELLDALPC
jgi:ankyrin repeat protein